MKTRFSASFFTAIFVLGFALTMSGRTDAGELMKPLTDPTGQLRTPFPFQGNCAEHGINFSDPGISQNVSTWSCHGATGGDKMLYLSYRGGPVECVYIDNFNNDDGQKRAFFVPLKTSQEWLAFRDPNNRPGGVRIRIGCPKTVFQDPCGNRMQLPDQPVSDAPEDAIRLTTQGSYEATFQCSETEPLPGTPSNPEAGAKLTSGCGAWIRIREAGNCSSPAP